MKLMKKLILLTAILLTCATLSPFTNMPAEAASKTQKIAKTTFQTTDNLNLRSGTKANDRVILTIPKGKMVTATAINGDRYNVSYTYKSKGKNVTKTGWVHKNFVKEYYQYTKTSKTYYEASKTANLRSTADTKKKVVSKIAKGNVAYSTQKVVNSIGQTWYRVSVSGKNYYVSSADGREDDGLYAYYGSYTYVIKAKNAGGTVTTVKGKMTIDEDPSWLESNDHEFIMDEVDWQKITLNLNIKVKESVDAYLHVKDYNNNNDVEVKKYKLEKGINKLAYTRKNIYSFYYIFELRDELGNKYQYEIW